MFFQVLLGILAIGTASGTPEDFEPLDAVCFNAAKLLICSKYQRFVKVYSCDTLDWK